MKRLTFPILFALTFILAACTTPQVHTDRWSDLWAWGFLDGPPAQGYGRLHKLPYQLYRLPLQDRNLLYGKLGTRRAYPALSIHPRIWDHYLLYHVHHFASCLELRLSGTQNGK